MMPLSRLIADLQDLFHNACVTVIKVVPSGTAEHNSLDNSAIFRDKNAGIRYLEQNPQVNYRNATVEENLKKAYGLLKEKYSDVKEKMTSKFVQQNISATLKIVWVYKNKGYVTSEKAIVGFVRSGQRFGADEEITRRVMGREDTPINFHKIITKTTTANLSTSDIDMIYEHAPAMIRSSLARGRLEDSVLDEMGVLMNDGSHKQRDNLVLWQQGPVIITHAKTVERHEAYKQRHITAAAEKLAVKTALKKNKKQEKAKKALANRLEKERQKEIAARAKQQEIIRQRGLSPAQKKVEKAQKKMALAATKLEKKQQEARKLKELERMAAGEETEDEEEGEGEEEEGGGEVN